MGGCALLVYSDAMKKGARQTRTRRTKWIGAALLLAVLALGVVTVMVFSPRSLRGPESVARQFVEALLQQSNDISRLRAAAHVSESDDPEILIDGLSTRVAFEYLRARARQGASHELRIVEGHRSGSQRYVAVLQVIENADGHATPARRFQVNLLKADDGDWRIVTVAVSD